MRLFPPPPPFRWHEPWAFARARAETFRSSKLRSMVVFTIILSVPIAAADPPTDASGFARVAGFALTGASIFAFVLVPLFSRLPHTVVIATDRVIVGKSQYPFKEIAHAGVGTLVLRGQQFPVLVFRTRSGYQNLYGLGPKIKPEELSAFLAKAGMEEPPA